MRKHSVRTRLSCRRAPPGRWGTANAADELPSEAHAAPKASELFIESRTDPRKSIAIQHLINNYFGPVPAKAAFIRFSQNGQDQRLVIPGFLNYRIRSLEIAPASEVKDYLYPWLYDTKQGITLGVMYSAPGQSKVEYSGTNAIIGRFRMIVPSLPEGSPQRENTEK